MKKTLMTLIAALFAGTAAFAAEDTVDTNADGVLSVEELVAAYPDLTDEVLAAMDANGDGTIDLAEHAAALEAGLVKPAE